VPHVGHAVCCNFGCWHWLQFAVDAGVAFHWLRRERVRERDIFRLGNGTVVLLYYCFKTSNERVSIPQPR